MDERVPETLESPLRCRCCGARSIGAYDEYEICGRCGWEDDPIQFLDPNYGGGANECSLASAQAAWAEIRELNRTTLLMTARIMLANELELIAGVRKICSLRLSFDADDPIFTPFVAVDSETDHFPLGDQRKLWAAAGLARVDAELGQYLKDAEGDIRIAIELLIQKYT